MWDDLKNRKLGRWAAGYLAAGWVVYEVLGEVSGNFDWAPVYMRVITVLIAVGFVLTLILAWYHGEKGQQRVRPAEVVLILVTLAIGASLSRSVASTSPEQSGSTPQGEVVLTGTPMNSLVVLPLRNGTGDPEQEFFSDGISEELMVLLSRVPGLRLGARTSSFALKNRELSADSIARMLNVRHILDGSVSRAGNSVRVAVALIDAVMGYELWSTTWRGAAGEVFDIQREIALAVVEALPLDPVVMASGWVLPDLGTSPEAHDLYLKGRESYARRTGDDLLAAVEYFNSALALEPDYAPAWAALAEAWTVIPGYTPVRWSASVAEVRRAASRALELDSTSVVALTALGYSSAWGTGDWDLGIGLLSDALDIDPGYANALHWRGELHAHAGNFDQARADLLEALDLDPLSLVTRADYAQVLQLAGDQQAAFDVARDILSADPDYLLGHYWRLYPALLLEEWGAATASGRAVAEGVGLDSEAVTLAISALRGTVDRAAAVDALGEQAHTLAGIGIVVLTALYGQLGALDEGFALLEEHGDGQVSIYLHVHPIFEPYWEDPRYEPRNAQASEAG